MSSILKFLIAFISFFKSFSRRVSNDTNVSNKSEHEMNHFRADNATKDCNNGNYTVSHNCCDCVDNDCDGYNLDGDNIYEEDYENEYLYNDYGDSDEDY